MQTKTDFAYLKSCLNDTYLPGQSAESHHRQTFVYYNLQCKVLYLFTSKWSNLLEASKICFNHHRESIPKVKDSIEESIDQKTHRE